MAQVTVQDVYRTRGDTYSLTITLKDSDGDPIDITGGSFTLTVDTLENPEDATTLDFSSSGTITNAAGGEVRFDFTAGNADQTPGVYYYDIQYVDAAAAVRTVLKGKWFVSQDITK